MVPVFDFIKVFFGGSKPPPYDEPFFSADSGFGLLPDLCEDIYALFLKRIFMLYGIR